jgi:hypothetical protein
MQAIRTLTDHFTIQGHSLKHLEVGCQDYAYGFSTPELDVAIVSDGCSSAPNSDVGARLLTLAAGTLISRWLPTALDNYPSITANQLRIGLETHLIEQLDQLFDTLNQGAFLGPLFLDCTLLIAARYKERAFVFMFGDGFVGVEYLDGSFQLIRQEYTASFDGVRHSAPNYLAYKMRAHRDRWIRYIAGDPKAETDTYVFKDTLWQPVVHTESDSTDNQFSLDLDYSKVRNIIVSSDGIASFDEGKTRLLEDTVNELMRFPGNAKGNILRRKMLFNSTRTWPSKGWKHHDDLGMAAILKQ